MNPMAPKRSKITYKADLTAKYLCEYASNYSFIPLFTNKRISDLTLTSVRQL
jgi:hypothetical protein